ncbi:MAG: energy transducer TonB [Chromatiales bacterium]|nr:energy transducer TonB [Chromatiales bacterium]MDH3931751.1 energy transducer TonB [Chromatiales bacterium]MDH3945276.1 energy transducer TonB [Chromatiales bacterium]MDH4012722.1 energy transducer TonB [Chromatiales bacterium]PLX56072.1 MAG: hypothetical protein C0629_09315 [Chromatiales bacterium]
MLKLEADKQAGDRFATTVFLAGLLHGMFVLGVTFGVGETDATPTNPSIEVVLLSDPDMVEIQPDSADYLAQANQHGAGNTEEPTRPSSAVAAPLDLAGDSENSDLRVSQAAPSSKEIESLHARADDDPDIRIPDESAEETALREQRLAKMQASPQQLLNESQQAPDPRISGDESRELYVAVNTRRSDVAEYLEGWRRKIERVGTLNFPSDAQRSRWTGNPTLEVAVRADGTLEEIVVRRSSGHRRLDQAALEILRLAAPFDPFPDRFKANYDVLRFAYEWQFIGGQIVDANMRVTTTIDDS